MQTHAGDVGTVCVRGCLVMQHRLVVKHFATIRDACVATPLIVALSFFRSHEMSGKNRRTKRSAKKPSKTNSKSVAVSETKDPFGQKYATSLPQAAWIVVDYLERLMATSRSEIMFSYRWRQANGLSDNLLPMFVRKFDLHWLNAVKMLRNSDLALRLQLGEVNDNRPVRHSGRAATSYAELAIGAVGDWRHQIDLGMNEIGLFQFYGEETPLQFEDAELYRRWPQIALSIAPIQPLEFKDLIIEIISEWRRLRKLTDPKGPPDAGLIGNLEIPERIKPENRTVEMSLSQAAVLLGIGGEDAEKKTRILRARIEAGVFRAECRSRQSYVFDKNEFSSDVWPQILPSAGKVIPTRPDSDELGRTQK